MSTEVVTIADIFDMLSTLQEVDMPADTAEVANKIRLAITAYKGRQDKKAALANSIGALGYTKYILQMDYDADRQIATFRFAETKRGKKSAMTFTIIPRPEPTWE